MRICNYSDFVDFLAYGRTVAFLAYCNAFFVKENEKDISFYSYETKMFTYDRYSHKITKESDFQSATTLYHLRKIFDILSTRDTYYRFKNMNTGGILYV